MLSIQQSGLTCFRRFKKLSVSHFLKDHTLLHQTWEGKLKGEAEDDGYDRSGTGIYPESRLLDGLLRAGISEQACLVRYADNVAALIAAHYVERASLMLNRITIYCPCGLENR